MDDDLGSVVFVQPEWIAMNGGWIHANNVLFYFAQSPFFDRTSSNQTIMSQSAGIPDREYENLSTRQRFEAALSRQVGLQYVVAHDPLESQAKFIGPNGEEQSDVWVIQRQNRRSRDDVAITGYYYIMNQAIFQAPSVASILSYRLLNTTVALNQVLSAAAKLPLFSATHGHTYLKPVRSTPTTMVGSGTATSKDPTPMPETQTSTVEKAETSSQSSHDYSKASRTLHDALTMSMRYGREYMDEMPLTGEPGAFRFAKIKEGTSQSQPRSIVPSSKLGTPAPTSRAGSPPPPPTIHTDVPPVSSKKSSAKSPGGIDLLKQKRRKSKPAISVE